MSNYFKFSNIDTTLGKRIFHSLFRTYGGNIDVTRTYGNSYEERLFDLEGFNFRRLQSLRNCGGPAVIKILSYYLSHGYVMDEEGFLRKNYKESSKDDLSISDITSLSDILSSENAKRLESKGITRVQDLVGKNYHEIIGEKFNIGDLKFWQEILISLAGRGYSFGYTDDELGKIKKSNVEYFPNIKLSETKQEKEERLGCSKCDRVKELELQLERMTRERDQAQFNLRLKEDEIEREREKNSSLLQENLNLRSEIKNIKYNNEFLRERLSTAAEALRPFIKKKNI